MKNSNKFKFYLKKIIEALGLKRKKYLKINLINELTLFAPGSAGNYKSCAALTLLSAQQTFPFLLELIKTLNVNHLSGTISADEFCTLDKHIIASNQLKKLFNYYGSDKSQQHDYHLIYGRILESPNDIKNILEIGMGTNNTDVVSNMGKNGKPGASLKAFKDYASNASIFGADIDKRILFESDRIKTYWVDQTNLESFTELNKKIPDNVDLIIDDGLHSPNANIAVLIFAINKVRVKGWIVIEDILKESLVIWQVISALLPNNFYSEIIM